MLDRVSLFSLFAVSVLGLAACSKEYAPTAEIPAPREATKFETEVKEMGTAERMQMPEMPAAAPSAAPAPAAEATPKPADPNGPRLIDAPQGDDVPQYRWNLPKGWVELEATPMRQINLRLESNADVEMYLTMLPGDGGGLLANINRWRQQMGLPELTQADVDGLPKQILLFKPATYVDLRGAYRGMGGDAKDNYAMLGLALIEPKRSAFIKMTGPAEVVDAHMTDFITFHQSIVPASDGKALMQLHAIPGEGDEAPAAPAEAAPAAEPMPAPAPEASAAGGKGIPPADQLKWDLPAGWEQSPARPMRVVSFTIGTTECYIAVLGGMAGGVEANINRWYGQMGAASLSSEQIDALEKIEVLGEPCALVDVEGSYTGMQGESIAKARMLGIVRASEEQSLFVKMTGPAEEVAAQVDNFKAFCKSLR